MTVLSRSKKAALGPTGRKCSRSGFRQRCLRRVPRPSVRKRKRHERRTQSLLVLDGSELLRHACRATGIHVVPESGVLPCGNPYAVTPTQLSCHLTHRPSVVAPPAITESIRLDPPGAESWT